MLWFSLHFGSLFSCVCVCVFIFPFLCVIPPAMVFPLWQPLTLVTCPQRDRRATANTSLTHVTQNPSPVPARPESSRGLGTDSR